MFFCLIVLGPLFVPGMSMGGPAGTMISGAGDNPLASLLGSAAPSSGSCVSTAQNANIEGLVSLLNQPPPSLSSLASIGPFDQFSPSMSCHMQLLYKEFLLSL